VSVAVDALPQQIPAIVDFEWARDVGVEGKAPCFTPRFLVTFWGEAGRDEARRDANLPHPAHEAFVELISR